MVKKKIMNAEIHQYPLTIQETDLDLYGHVNNTSYLILFEQARWDLITKNGWGLKKINEMKQGPVILELNLRFHKELNARDEIIIQTQMNSYLKKIGKMTQKMLRGDELCCTLDVTFGLFDLKERKLLLPNAEWLKGIGYSQPLV